MKDGFIKVAAASPMVRVADCGYNAGEIIQAAKRAAGLGASLLVTPELGITGYTCGDLFFQTALLDGAEAALREIASQTADLNLLLVVGLPLRHHGKLYNCAAVLCGGLVIGLVPKSHLPNYAEFQELRHFTPAFAGLERFERGFLKGVVMGAQQLFRCARLPGFTLAVEICEDLWVPAPPSILHTAAGATVIANLSASSETVGKADWRRSLVSGHSGRLVCGYVYADAGAGESSTDLVFAGQNLIAENGALLADTGLFSDEIAVSEIDLGRLEHDRRRLNTFHDASDEGYVTVLFELDPTETRLTRPVSPLPFVPQDGPALAARSEDILAIQAAGLQKRLEHTAAQTVVLGVSGGLDSTLALLVAVRTLERMKRPLTDLCAVTMPGFGTTGRTRSNAEKLCGHLGVTLLSIDISDTTLAHFRDIGHDDNDHSVVYENAQARVRTLTLMDLANQKNGLVLGTGDLSELALGWATYNGDHMSMYGVNASVPKTLIRHLIAHEAGRRPQVADILQDILDTPVSPELLPPENGEISQQTEQLVGPYELHDFFLYYMLRWGFAPSKIARLACHAFSEKYGENAISKWMRVFYRRFFAQQFKRSCLPDGPKVGSVSLSPRGDWRMPSDAQAALWLADLDNQ